MKLLATASVPLFFILFPLFSPNDYYLNVMIIAMINIILAIGLNLLIGYAGQISLGHAAFYGIGSYASGVLTVHLGLNPWLAFAAAALLTSAVAYIVGLPTLKLKGHYLAVATLGFGIIVHIAFKELTSLTGGPSGLIGIPKLKVASFRLDTDVKYYFFVLGLASALLILARNLINSRIGRALRALNSNEIAAETMGVDTAKLKLKIFIVSAAYASVAGSLYAHYINFISPDTFGFGFSIELVAMVVVGGIGDLAGGAIGAGLLTILPESLRVVKDYDILVFGSILIFMLIFMPKGLIEGIRHFGALLQKAPSTAAGGPADGLPASQAQATTGPLEAQFNEVLPKR